MRAQCMVILMSEKIKKIEKCALQVLEKLKDDYDIDQTDTIIKASTNPCNKDGFSFMLNITHRKFELFNPKQIENPVIKRCLDVLNRHLKICLDKI